MTPSIKQIQERTCEVFGITMDHLVSKSKKAIHAKPRQLAMRWCRELGYRVRHVSDAFECTESSVTHNFRDAKGFTKLELEHMEQVKASFLGFMDVHHESKVALLDCRQVPFARDYDTRIECWKPRGNKIT